MAAFWGGLVDKSERFLEHIGKVVAPIASCRQELVIAIRKHDWSRTMELLGDPEIDMYGEKSDVSPLHLACAHDFAQCVDYLVESGVSVDLRDRKAQETPLHHAARGGHFRVCKYLVEKGASPALRNDKNQTPYDVATQLNLRQWILPLQLQAEGEAEDAAAVTLGPPPSGMPPPPMTMPAVQPPAAVMRPPMMATPQPPSVMQQPTMSAAPPPSAPQPPMAPTMQPASAPPAIMQQPLQTMMPAAAAGQPLPGAPPTMPLAHQSSAPPPPALQQPLSTAPPPPRVPSEQQSSSPPPAPAFPVAAPPRTERTAIFVPSATTKQSTPTPTLPKSAPIRPVVFQPPVVRADSAAMRPTEPRTIFRPPPAEPVQGSPPIDDSKPKPRPAPRPYSKYNQSSSLRNDKRDALGRYADGFHSSASDPVLAAKYGNNTATNPDLPPPPTNIPPPPTRQAMGAGPAAGYPTYARPGSASYAGGQYAAPPPMDFSEPPRPT